MESQGAAEAGTGSHVSCHNGRELLNLGEDTNEVTKSLKKMVPLNRTGKGLEYSLSFCITAYVFKHCFL